MGLLFLQASTQAHSLPGSVGRDSLEDVRDAEADSALHRLFTYMHARSERLPAGWIFGPNTDDAYFYRMRFYHTNEIFEDELASPQRAEALAAGIPAIEDVPRAEREALIHVNYLARRTALDTSTQFLVVKHFPGGPRMLESTEGVAFAVVFPGDSTRWAGELAVYRGLITCGVPPMGIMTSHASYPGLERALAVQHPDLRPIVPDDTLLPATFSPLLLRGLLRRGLGYQGIIVSDWVDMGAVNRHLLDRRAALDAALPRSSPHARVFLLCVHAGVELITGMRNRLLRERRQRSISELVDEIAAIVRPSERWEQPVRRAAEHVLATLASAMRARRDTTAAVSIEDCIRIILGEQPTSPALRWMEASRLENFQDLWNRQGILHVLLRSWYVAERFGITLPELPFGPDNERVFGREVEKAWLVRLTSDASYREASRRVCWDSPASVAAWRRCVERWRAVRPTGGQTGSQ